MYLKLNKEETDQLLLELCFASMVMNEEVKLDMNTMTTDFMEMIPLFMTLSPVTHAQYTKQILEYRVARWGAINNENFDAAKQARLRLLIEGMFNHD